MKRLDCVWSQTKLSVSTNVRIYSTCVLPILMYGSEIWTLIQADWRRQGSRHIQHITLSGTISSPMPKSCVVLASSTSHLSYANENSVSSATLPDFRMLYWQISSFESASRRETVSGHRRNGDVPVVDHTPPGSTRSAVTRVLQRLTPWSSWRTDRSGGRSQRRKSSAKR